LTLAGLLDSPPNSNAAAPPQIDWHGLRSSEPSMNRATNRRGPRGQTYDSSVEAETDRGHARPGELVPERVVIATEFDPFLSLRTLSAYAGLSVRTLRQYLDLAPDQALPCYRVGGKILVRRSQFDAWIEQYRTRGRPGLVRALQDFGLDTSNR
jgi:excisionase family DNA binding protein